jgi:hypothetical protein
MSVFLISFVALRPNAGQGLLILEVSRSRHTTVGRTPLDEWSVRRIDLYLTTHKFITVISMPTGGIRTNNPKKRATVDPRLTPRCQWDHHSPNYSITFLFFDFQRYVLFKSPAFNFQRGYADKKCNEISDETKHNSFMFAFRSVCTNRQNGLLESSFLPSVCLSVRLSV